METQHRNVKTYLMNTMEKQTKSSSGVTVDTTILEGCFKGMDHYLSKFADSFKADSVAKRKMYDILVKSCTHPNEGKERRMYRRAALNLFSHHCQIWEKQLLEDCQHWYFTIKEWTESFNAEVKFFLPLGCVFTDKDEKFLLGSQTGLENYGRILESCGRYL